MKKPADLVEALLDDDVQTTRLVQKVVATVEQYLGDVITPETDDDTAREECWTLCIDKANDLVGRGTKAIAVAKEACARLGYPPKGYRARTAPSGKTFSASALRPREPGEAEDPLPPPSGVVHKAWRPDFVS